MDDGAQAARGARLPGSPASDFHPDWSALRNAPLHAAFEAGATEVQSMSSVSPLTLARWQDLQHAMRQLALQRGLRFVAVAVLAPFGITAVDEEAPGKELSFLAFGLTLLLLALAELASLAESGLHARNRNDIEKAHPELSPKDKPGRLARTLAFVSGPGFSTALYALMGGAFLAGGAF